MSNQYQFNKPALSTDDQISMLKDRGMLISSSATTKHFLETIGYYRLKSYFKPFLIDTSNSDKGFISGTTFSQVLQLYIFDRELRLLFTDALERIEVTLRVAISNAMSTKYGPHWYLNDDLFINKKHHQLFLAELDKHIKRSKEGFVKSYYKKYSEPAYPPSWMVMECLSFGTISQLYNNIKDRSSRKKIGDTFGQYNETIKSWMRALTYTRNICAHHSRLWNRFFVNTPKNVDITLNFNRDKSPFIIQAYIIIKLMNVIAPGNHWKERLLLLFEEHATLIPFHSMGFDKDWQNSKLWLL